MTIRSLSYRDQLIFWKTPHDLLHAIANLTLPHLGYADVVKPAPLLNNPRQTTDIFDGLELEVE